MILTLPRILSLFTCCFLAILLPTAHADDIDTLNARLKGFYVTKVGTDVEDYVLSQRSDGSWVDIDYEDKGRVNWSRTMHFSHLRNMSVAFNTEGHKYNQDSNLLDAIFRGLDYWYGLSLTSDNWWHATIGQQLQLGSLLILMHDHLSPGSVGKGAAYMNDPRLTGLNLTDMATQTVIRGLLNHSLDDINNDLQAIEDEIDVTTGTTIKVDQLCIVLLHETGARLEVTIASPEARPIPVRIDLISSDKQNRSQVFHLPGGESDAGKSVTHTFPLINSASTGRH